MGDVWPWVGGFAASATVLLTLTNKVSESPVIGWMGRTVKWAGRRQYERENRETIELRAEVHRLDERLSRMDGKLDRQTVQLDRQSAEIEDRDNYIVYVVEWVRDLRMTVAEMVPPFALPDFKSFKEWRDNK